MKSGNFYKIGVADNPAKRVKELQTGNPEIALIYESAKISNAYQVESQLHKMFRMHRITGEWFSIQDKDKFVDDVRLLVEKTGIITECKDSDFDYEKINELVRFALQEQEAQLEMLDREIDAISAENRKLAEKLMDLGWSCEEIKKIIDESEADVDRTICAD